MRVMVMRDGVLTQVMNPEYIITMKRIYGERTHFVATARLPDGKLARYKLSDYIISSTCLMEEEHV